MSLLPPEIIGALQELLQALQSADNHIRSQAEEKLNGEWMQKPSILLMGLVETIHTSADAGVSLNLFLDISNVQRSAHLQQSYFAESQ